MSKEISRRRFLELSLSAPAVLLLACSQKFRVQESSYAIEDLRVTVQDETRQIELDEFEQKMTGYTNSHRIYEGLHPLSVDAALVAVARIRSREMAGLGYFSHTRKNDTTAFTILAEIGYTYIMAGENIARNEYPRSEATDISFNGFMNSFGHKANILEPRYNRLGIGHAERNRMHYFTQIFARRV